MKGLGLVLSQQQKLVLTPALQTALHILQLPTLELQELLNKEISENPFLEEGDSTKDINSVSAENQLVLDEDKENNIEISLKNSSEIKLQDWDKYINDGATDFGYVRTNADSEDRKKFYEESIEKPESLAEYLWEQLSFVVTTEEEYDIGEEVIANINDDGYLTVSVEEIATDMKLPVSNVEKILNIIQTFEPIGVGARDIKECLLLQLKVIKNETERNTGSENLLVQEIIKEHWDNFKLKRYKDIAKSLNIPIEDICNAAVLISKLNPHPGRSIGNIEPRYIYPDAVIEEDDNKYIISLNDEGLPKLKINSIYKKLLKDIKSLPESTKKFMENKFQKAIGLINGIEQRKTVFCKVIDEIFNFQNEFFKNGEVSLKPLTLDDIAKKISMHESTVSMVVANKYIQTPKGIFPLKYFFTSSISINTNSPISAMSVKESVKDILLNEDLSNPLSDQDIVNELVKKGINIARRTVNKYREELRILTASQRKKVGCR